MQYSAIFRILCRNVPPTLLYEPEAPRRATPLLLSFLPLHLTWDHAIPLDEQGLLCAQASPTLPCNRHLHNDLSLGFPEQFSAQ